MIQVVLNKLKPLYRWQIALLSSTFLLIAVFSLLYWDAIYDIAFSVLVVGTFAFDCLFFNICIP